jgi:amino acid transporter
VIAYGTHGVAGFQTSELTPTRAVFFGLVPILLFNYVGFELQNGAAEEMENPQKDVPLSVLRSGIAGVLMYVIPIFCILLVLPANKVTGIGGFIDAVTLTFHGVYGGAAHALLIVMTIGFVGALITSGAVWMIGSDRIQAVASYDGAFIPFFGVFNKRLGTPVRVNVLSGITSSAFAIAAIYLLKNASTASAFAVVLDIAISTTLISYLWIFPAAPAAVHPSGRRAALPRQRYGMGRRVADHGVGVARLVRCGVPGVLEKILASPTTSRTTGA